MKQKDLERLESVHKRIQEIVEEWGLSVKPTDFDVVPAQRMFEIMAYHMPVNFRHWSRGRDYERIRTIYEHSGTGVPYETVLNTNPPKAFLMETNPFPVQVMVIAHVYAHVDFFIENQYFKKTSEDMIVQAYEAARRFDHYEQLYGVSRLERLCDAGLALQMNIDPDTEKRNETKEEQIDRIYGVNDEEEEVGDDDFFRLFPRKKKKRPDFQEFSRKTPLEPERDVLGYIIANSQKPLQEWEQDVLSVIRSQGIHLYPQARTKIVNEGWASYWHEKIMRRLFEERYLTPEEHGTYAKYHAAVLTFNPFKMNPYLIGKRIIEDIKERWDKGRFGKQWRECEDEYELQNWDTGLNKGAEKILKVRKLYSDRMLIEHFLTDEIINELKLYIYQKRKGRDGRDELVIVEKRPEVIRQQLKELHSDLGMPRIVVQDGNFNDRGEILLKHVFEGVPLDKEYLQKTMEHVYYIWGRKVHLSTVDVEMNSRGGASQKKVIYSFDEEEGHNARELKCGSDCTCHS